VYQNCGIGLIVGRGAPTPLTLGKGRPVSEQMTLAPVRDLPCEARLSLLGAFRLEIAGSAVALPAGPQRLLALLCLRDRMTRRQVSGSLWPETSTAQALTNLRNTLWRLQKAVGRTPVILETGNELELSPAVSSDIAWMRAVLTRQGEPTPHPAPPQDDLLHLTRAQTSELLADWDEDWLEDDRERIRQLRLHVLERWALHLADHGDHGLALEAALAAVRTDPLRESAHRAVIQVHLAEGNLCEAHRAFDKCRTVLLAELGIEPGSDTCGLFAG